MRKLITALPDGGVNALSGLQGTQTVGRISAAHPATYCLRFWATLFLPTGHRRNATSCQLLANVRPFESCLNDLFRRNSLCDLPGLPQQPTLRVICCFKTGATPDVGLTGQGNLFHTLRFTPGIDGIKQLHDSFRLQDRERMNEKKNYTYHLIAIFTVGVWGLTFISTKVLIANGLSPKEIFLLRFLIAYIGIWFISPRKLFANNWKDELWLLLGGITGGSVYFLTENMALGITLATNVAFIVCTAPLLTTIFSLMIYKKEKATRTLIGGSLMALVGVAMVVYNGSFVLKISPLGDFLTLLAALSWAFYSLIMKKMTGRYNTIFITRKIFFYGILTILPVFLFQPWQADLSLLMEPSVLLNLLFLGVLASLVCFAVWNVVLKNLGTVRASNYIYLNPLFTLVGSAVLLDEHLTIIALIGAGCIMGGVYIAGRK